jgi:hypothetical protein
MNAARYHLPTCSKDSTHSPSRGGSGYGTPTSSRGAWLVVVAHPGEACGGGGAR